MVILLAVVIARGRQIVGRLIRLRQLAHPFELPVYVARLRRLRSAKRQCLIGVRRGGRPTIPARRLPSHDCFLGTDRTYVATTSGRGRAPCGFGNHKSFDLFFDFVCERRGAGPVHDPMIERKRERNDFCAFIFAFVGN